MCEFCKQHGEGKQWYLQMQNYSEALLHEPLTEEQQAVAGAPSRVDWLNGFLRYFVSASAGPTPPKEDSGEQQGPAVQPGEAELVRRAQIVHFGQVIPIEDVEKMTRWIRSLACRAAAAYIRPGRATAATALASLSIGLTCWMSSPTRLTHSRT